jgi:hypothetical protein
VVSSLLLASAFLGWAAANRAAHTTATLESFDHNGIVDVVRHPRRFKVESADSYVVFSGLQWSHWGGQRSIAAGGARTCDYAGNCSSAHTRLVAGRRQRCGDDFSYDQITATVIPLYGQGPFELPVIPGGCVNE